MDSYSSRAWLSEDTHSSAFIFCYFNKNCFNSGYRFFIKIADCTDVFLIPFQLYQIKIMIKRIEHILEVINGKRSFYIWKYHKTRYKIIYNEFKNDKQLDIVLSSRNWFTDKTIISIHKDKHTCNEEQWQRKLYVLQTELSKFSDFLSEQVTKIKSNN